MGSLEIITYVTVASLTLGFLICWLTFVLPARWEIEARKLNSTRRGLQKVRDDMDEIAYRAELRNAVHKGTPYIPRPANELERLLVDVADPHLEDRLADNTRWSRKASGLRAVES